jgi:hypothetical protein
MVKSLAQRKRYPEYDKEMCRYMNLTKQYIYTAVPYSTIKRIYEFFKNESDLKYCKIYLYESNDTRMISERKKDTIWRLYTKDKMVIGMNHIKEFRKELSKPNFNIPQFVGLNPVTPYNELSIE